MNNNPILEMNGMVTLHNHVSLMTFLLGRVYAGVRLEVMDSENVRGLQTIRARMPIGGITRIRGSVKNRDTYRLAIHRAVVVDPLGALAPDAFLGRRSLSIDHAATLLCVFCD